jgi:hypothetical protein
MTPATTTTSPTLYPGGVSSTPGAPPLRSSRRGQAAAARVGSPNLGRSAPPRVVGVRRPMLVPLAVSGRPSAPWPGVPPAVPSMCSSRPPAGPGALPTPGAAPCVPSGGVGRPLLGLGRFAPPRSVGLAGRCPRGPRLSAPADPLALRPPTAAFGGPRGSSSLALSPLPGLCPTAPWRLTPAPPLVRS